MNVHSETQIEICYKTWDSTSKHLPIVQAVYADLSELGSRHHTCSEPGVRIWVPFHCGKTRAVEVLTSSVPALFA